jgi:hypothetical protein
MGRTGRAYEKPSRISQGLVVGLSVAVVLMSGWLAITIMFSHFETAAIVDDTDMTSAMTSAPVSVENASSKPDEPSVTERLNSAYLYFEPLPRDYASATAAPPRSALPLAAITEPPRAVARDPAYPPLSIATAVPDANYRGIPADGPLQTAAPVEATDVITDLLRLPPLPPPHPPPHARDGGVGVASIPMPRPRPRLEGEDVQPPPPYPPPLAGEGRVGAFDFQIDRQR